MFKVKWLRKCGYLQKWMPLSGPISVFEAHARCIRMLGAGTGDKEIIAYMVTSEV